MLELVHFIGLLLVATTVTGVGIGLWLARTVGTPMWLSLVVAVATVVVWVIAVVQYRLKDSRFASLLLGAEGERRVAHVLAELRAKGYSAYHDLAGNRGNIDHVLIGPSGLYVIETKTVSKPVRGKAEITLRNGVLHAHGVALTRDPVGQVRAAADEVRRRLPPDLAKTMHIQPIVCFPGWFIDRGARPEGVWVLTETAIAGWIAQEEARRGVLPTDAVCRANLIFEDWARLTREKAMNG